MRNKLKAFTLAEVMVLLLTLSILMAAFAPVFTRRYNNVTSDDVWSFVSGDNNYNAYFDTPNKLFVNQAYIGLQPMDENDVKDIVKNGAGEVLYSKIIIGASKKIGGVYGQPPQQQMQFRYGSASAEGSLVGSLFAGNGNMLLGGPYKTIKDSAVDNTAFGTKALKNVETAKGNTALGRNALATVNSGGYNTAIGYSAGESINIGSFNTFVGTYSGADTSVNVNYNTLIGYASGQNVSGSANTALGNFSLNAKAGSGNTAVGNSALRNATGNYNTAVGYNSLVNMKKGNYNTAIGYNSCGFIGYSSSSEISKITCIGANSAKEDKSSNTGSAGLPTGDNVPDRVFIGTSTGATNSTISAANQKAFALLEVHNSINGPNAGLFPIANGEESVLINGNLVVRGQPYFEAAVYRAIQPGDGFNQAAAPKALMLFDLQKKYDSGFSVLSGFDGAFREGRSYEICNGCQQHKFDDIRPNCICTSVGPGYSGDTTFKNPNTNVRYSSTSYDWFTPANYDNGYSKSCGSGLVQGSYTDKSTGNKINLSRSPGGASGSSGGENWGSKESDRPLAHLSGKSCCPNLSSDIRLKNVGEKYLAGLEEIKKINVYNYTFKNDVNKLPQVGVVAQDLKRVFPTAVEQGEDGYYKIRWSEMFYAAINAIKTLNSKVETLVQQIVNDKEKIATLKRENASMYAQLDKLAEELEVLEAKKRK